MSRKRDQWLTDMITCLEIEIGEWNRDFEAFEVEIDALGQRIQALFERGETP